jgi:hypothetical protein
MKLTDFLKNELGWTIHVYLPLLGLIAGLVLVIYIIVGTKL